MSPEKARRAEPTTGRITRFNYADYVELRGWEFDKFRRMSPISEEELADVDLASLAARLLGPLRNSGDREA